MSQKPATLWNLVDTRNLPNLGIQQTVTFFTDVADQKKYMFLKSTRRDLFISGVVLMK